MRKIVFYFTLLAFMATSSSCKDKQEPCFESNPLEGTWRLAISNEIQIPDSLNRIKILNKTHFMWMDDSSSSSLAGIYVSSDTTYTETITYASPAMCCFNGQKAIFNYKIKADSLYIFGRLSDSIDVKETWVRVK